LREDVHLVLDLASVPRQGFATPAFERGRLQEKPRPGVWKARSSILVNFAINVFDLASEIGVA